MDRDPWLCVATSQWLYLSQDEPRFLEENTSTYPYISQYVAWNEKVFFGFITRR